MRFNIITEYGGLGDQLFYSHIPEIIKTQFPDAVVNVSCKRKIRSQQTNDFIWGNNPYVDSFDIDCATDWPLSAINFEVNDNLLARVAKNLGLDCDVDASPKIYRDVEENPDFFEKVVVDLNYKSYVGAFSKVKVEQYLSRYDNPIIVNNPGWVTQGTNIKINDIEAYAGIIKSCETFICFTSGGASLACALDKKAICIYGRGQDKIFHHCSSHTYLELSHGQVRAFFVNVVLKIKSRTRRFYESIFKRS